MGDGSTSRIGIIERNTAHMNTAVCLGLAMLTTCTPCVLAGASTLRQGYLGVDVRDITVEEVIPLKLKDTHGAEIILVDHDAPAGKCGLHERDVVLMMDGLAIQDQEQLRHMLHDSPPGKTIVLVISHDGQQRTVTTQMAVSQEEVERQAAEQRLSVPEPQEQPAQSTVQSTPSTHSGNSLLGFMVINPSYTGLYLEKMSTQLASYFGVSSGGGLLVRSVQENSPAALAGMHAGDVVIRANNKDVASTNEWTKAIKNSHGRPVTVVVVRDKREQTLMLTPDGKKRSSLEPLASPQHQDQTPDGACPGCRVPDLS
jgi:serine protease Do